MAAHLTEQDYQTVLGNLEAAKGNPRSQKRATKARGRVRIPGTMNKTEERYAAHLENLKRIGAVLWYKFEGVTFKLARKTSYSPDFVVMLPDGAIECHEVKGTTKRTDSAGVKHSKPYFQEDAHVKVKVAAESFPFQFVVVYFVKEKGWERLEY
jgi:hypothetical protein